MRILAPISVPRRGKDARRSRSGVGRGLHALLLSLLAVLMAPAVASAATLQVSESGSDTGDCVSAACATIGYAVGEADPGDVVEVEAGTYPVDSTVVLDKAVTLAGAQAGVDARSRDLPPTEETVIEPDGTVGGTLIRLSAVGATVDGVTVSGNSQSGIQMMNASSGYAVRNSILTGNEAGIDMETTGVDAEQSVIEFNRFEANNELSLRSGIYGDDTASNVNIVSNLFRDHTNVPINISGDAPARTQEDLLIAGNTFQNERHLLLLNAERVFVNGNTFSDGRSQAIAVQGGVDALQIYGNTITGAVDSGILFADYYSAGPNTGTSILGNTIVGTGGSPEADSAAITVTERDPVSPGDPADPGYDGTLSVFANRIVGNAAGVWNGVSGVTVDATNNWWGCNAGPGASGCDTLAGPASVNAAPHLVLTGSASPSSVEDGETATVEAAIETNSAGQSASLAASGTPVSFEAERGSLSQASSFLMPESATSVFTAGSSTGSAGVTVSVDNQVVPVELDVVEPPEPSPSPEPPPPPPVNPPAPSPPPPPAAQVVKQARTLLGGGPIRVDRGFKLSSSRVLVPRTSGQRRQPSRVVPVVRGNQVRISRAGVLRRNPQRLLALGAPRGGVRARVAQVVRIGRRTLRLPVQRMTVRQGSARALRLPITKAMRQALVRGRSVVLRIRLVVADTDGNRENAVKAFRLRGVGRR